MAGATTTNFAAVLKTIWPQEDLEDLFFENLPLYAQMPKDTSWDGEARIITLLYGVTNGRSSSFGNAKANKKASKVKKMTVFTADNFSLWSVDHKLVKLSRSNKGAIVKALTTESKSALLKLKRMVGVAMWGDGGGWIGKIAAAGISTNTITLTDKRNARNMEEGDIINLAADNGYTASAGVRSGTLEVSAVNRKTGVITFTTNVTAGIPLAAAADYLFIDGDYAAWIKGAEYYVPANDPGSSGVPVSIWGMSRAADVTRLAGVRPTVTGLLIQDAIKTCLKEAFNEEAKITHVFMNPDNFLDLELDLGTRVRYVDTKVGNVGFTGIQFTSHGGKPVEVYPDADCPYNLIRGFGMDGWTFASAGEFPDFLNFDGSKSLMVEEASNSGEGRLGGYSQAYTETPRDNFVASLA